MVGQKNKYSKDIGGGGNERKKTDAVWTKERISITLRPKGFGGIHKSSLRTSTTQAKGIRDKQLRRKRARSRSKDYLSRGPLDWTIGLNKETDKQGDNPFKCGEKRDLVGNTNSLEEGIARSKSQGRTSRCYADEKIKGVWLEKSFPLKHRGRKKKNSEES